MLPGLLCVVSNGQHSVTRIDRRLSFDWTDSLIESRVADVQSVTWSGNLLVRTGGRHTFHAQVSGGVTVSVDEHVVFSAEGANVFASGTAVDLAAGDHRIQVEFQTTLKHPDGKVPADSKMQLFWSSPDFTLEPLPADALTHVVSSQHYGVPSRHEVTTDGALYIGSIWDSGWQGGANTGSIERLTADTSMPNGIREIRATASGFEVSFFKPLENPALMSDAATWSVQGYTLLWSGSYATPDSERYTLVPRTVKLSEDRRTAILQLQPLKPGFVYEIGVAESVASKEGFWPAEGFYSMKVLP